LEPLRIRRSRRALVEEWKYASKSWEGRESQENPVHARRQPGAAQSRASVARFVQEIVPGLKETVHSWGVPTFEAPAPFCLYMISKNHLTFGFHFGTSLDDPEGLLEGTGKNIRHMKLFKVEDLEQKGLRELVQSAARGKAPMKGMSGKRKSG
jgi:hypothetical protein